MAIRSVTYIGRYVTIGSLVVVAIRRGKEEVDAYANPPGVGPIRTVWGTCHAEAPDHLVERGTLRATLTRIASRRSVAAAAAAAPERFAEMLADAHGRGRIITAGSLALEVVAERVRDARGYSMISVSPSHMRFHTIEMSNLFGPDKRRPGVHRWTYSFEDLSMKRRLVEPIDW